MYTKEDVTLSYHQGRHGDPMVNVKVRAFPLLDTGFRQFAKEDPTADERFTQEWVEAHFSEKYLDAIFWRVCEWEWEYAQDYAREIFESSSVELHAEGRSGGWCVVTGLDDVADWDAVQLAKWRKFERYARAAADHIPGDLVNSLYYNEFETTMAEEHARLVELEPDMEAAVYAVSR